jgi:AraC family transcriptional regulator
MPPARYRKEGPHRAFEPENGKESPRMYDITIRTMVEQALLGIPHAGSYMGIGKAYRERSTARCSRATSFGRTCA